ncbi:peptidase inhibitor I9 [Terfezia claveryi]|nr:peptidase inhibitor I9 [Terfezia claveryi]
MADCTYIITLKEDATDAEVQAVKDQVVASGGKIEHDYPLIKGFSATLPAIHTLESHPKVLYIEKDQIVRTQSK